jgi:lipopolysaccharide transport system permease protein
VPAKYRIFFALNPMTGVVDGFRWALLGSQQSAPNSMWIVSSLIAVIILISGLFYFRRMERTFADLI